MSANGGGAILEREEENDAEVRREDQENINTFGRLNARLYEVRDESDQLKKKLERLDDASTELMMVTNGDQCMLQLGDAFFETTDEEATEHCDTKVDVYQAQIDKLEEEANDIVEKQNELKSILYARFGKSINLEDK